MSKMKKITAGIILGTSAALGAAEAAASRTQTVMFVGDSISCGIGTSSQEARFSTVAVQMLNNNEAGIKYVEKNIAVSGSSMCQTRWPVPQASAYPDKLKSVIAAKPDIVVMQHGVNDQTTHSSIGEFAWSYRQFIREAKAALPDARFVILTITPTRRGGELARFHDESNTIIQEIAAREKIMLAPVHWKLDGRLDLFPDGLHPNDAGHRIIAETVVETILKNQPMSPEKFNFIMRRAGTYRLMGYAFFIPEKSAKSGITCFYEISEDGFTYSSYGDVTVSSPFLIYPREIACFGVKDAAFRYDKYHNSYSVKLPSTGGKPVKVSFR